MRTTLPRRITQSIRNLIPLPLRQRFGPAIAYCVYVWRVYFTKNDRVPKVLSLEETVKAIVDNNLSVIRFGDGEMSLMNDVDLSFQKKNRELTSKLETILKTHEPGLLICIPNIWNTLDGFTKQSFRFILHHLFRYGYVWKALLSLEQTYGDAYITRPYLGYKDKSRSSVVFDALFSVWRNQDVVLFEGEKSRLGVGNNLFTEVKSLERILCPAENAYAQYEKIKAIALCIPKNKLVLVSLGPTAKVLAYDLFKAGYRVLDIGHIDMEYEMFLRASPTLISIPYKYFNEINERSPEECTDGTYQSQIVARIV